MTFTTSLSVPAKGFARTTRVEQELSFFCYGFAQQFVKIECLCLFKSLEPYHWPFNLKVVADML